MICVRDKSATLSRTCPGLCRKVGVMELGLYPALHRPSLVILNWCWLVRRRVRSRESAAAEQSDQDEEDGRRASFRQSVVQRVVLVQNGAIVGRRVQRQFHSHAASEQSAPRSAIKPTQWHPDRRWGTVFLLLNLTLPKYKILGGENFPF